MQGRQGRNNWNIRLYGNVIEEDVKMMEMGRSNVMRVRIKVKEDIQ